MKNQEAGFLAEACGDSSVLLMTEKAKVSIARTWLRQRNYGISVDAGGWLPSGNQPELSFASHALNKAIPIGIEGCCIHRGKQFLEETLYSE